MSVSALSSSTSSIPALLQMSGGNAPVQDTQAAPPPPPRGPGGKEKMESLLSSQVQAGNLSQDQADSLKGFFESLATQGPRGTEGPNGPRPPKDKAADKAADRDGDKDGGAEGAGDKDVSVQSNPAANMISKSVSDALAAFLKNLQDPNGSSAGYGAPAKTAITPSLVVDQKV